MSIKKREFDRNSDLFRQELKDLVDPGNRLVILSDFVDWNHVEEAMQRYYPAEVGNPATPSRLMAGLLYLKALYNASDEALVRTWVENPYWQYFCGEQYFRHDLPINPSSLSKWRKRLGKDGHNILLGEILGLAMRVGFITRRELLKVNVDTTVQEKNIRYPTDSQLYHKCRVDLVNLAYANFIPLRQSYRRLGQGALSQANRYGHAKQYRRMRSQIKKLKNYLGRVTREIERYCEINEVKDLRLQQRLSQANQLLIQTRDSKDKLYSLHSPEVECIGKGKVRKAYEFGVKVGFVSTSKSGWLLSAQALHGNPYDGHTLTNSLDQAIENVGVIPEYTFVDKGYRGHEERRTKVFISGQRRSVTPGIKRWLKRRSAIEPIIGHMKQSHGLDCNRLKGKVGDHINAISAAIGYNLTLVLHRISTA